MNVLNKLKNKKGFTLIEMIVVIVIIGILAAVLIGSLTGYIRKSRVASAKMEAGNVLTAVQAYASENESKGVIKNPNNNDTNDISGYVSKLIGVTINSGTKTATGGVTGTAPCIISVTADSTNSTIKEMIYKSQNGYICTYDSSKTGNDAWEIEK